MPETTLVGKTNPKAHTVDKWFLLAASVDHGEMHEPNRCVAKKVTVPPFGP